MRLERLELQDFRGFRSLDLTFDSRLTVLVGRNGAGKTTILNAIVVARRHLFEPSDIRAGSDRSGVVLITDKGTFSSDFGPLPTSLQAVGNAGDQFVLLYGVERHATDQTPGSTPGTAWHAGYASENWENAPASYQSLFTWLREMEDLENEQIRHSEGAVHPQLEAVRRAVTSFFPGYSALRIRRHLPPLSTRPVLTLEKDRVLLPFDALSEGERNSIAMVADIARRLSLLGSNGHGTEDPLAREGIVLIDEIEQHLHPGWQRHFIRQLPKTFPGLQFVVTTQSPVIVSEVAAENLRVLKDFQLVETHHHQGRDANSVLEETFETSARPADVDRQLGDLANRLDERKFDEAEPLLRTLEGHLGETDPDVVYYRNIFERIRPRE